MKLNRMLQEWFLDEVETAPRSDSRRTPNCLSLGELESAARDIDSVSATKLTHMVQCAWCQKNLVTFRQLDQEPSVASNRAVSSMAISPQLISVQDWTPEKSIQLSSYLTSSSYLEREQQTPMPAHFDNEGNLRVHWNGLDMEGLVSISLIWEGDALALADGQVHDGQLQLVKPLSELGLRNLELSANVLALELVT